ncbi:glycosyltransferase family 2 protein [Desulfobaculum bizertense]|uniref:Glycosyltransferase involved in cell wall bisynthesis n=1 Tax=Desulfobaculum bizertense DSM 18034 TaxID=1121442 RepID=A0A1T4VEW1_9BACT|nr:glycosyltransferase family 2 protein [Desulfobaculum bizertense]UIJ37694.1 glycosyltransferase family 2 protein [Desulfobaculum bizertense]SKA63514.1 Glycosyltransferase involved in cell wall bisynthesis [Desulfobaculum bizertense DSM 18034]
MNNIKTATLVIPVFNEEENLPILFKEISKAMDRTIVEWTVLFVDDASTDTSLEVIKNLAEQDEHVRYLAFAQNCGQSAAFGAGFAAAKSDVIITMDADLQNDPADIPAMIQNMQTNDADMVIGWRVNRKDTAVKRVSSRIANKVRNAMTKEVGVHDTGCSLKIMRTDMAQKLPMFTGMHRFLPTLMKMHGAKVEEQPVNHRHRQHGVSKYGTWDRLKASSYDLIAVRWMQQRFVQYQIKEKN